jgi:hypothetical protein
MVALVPLNSIQSVFKEFLHLKELPPLDSRALLDTLRYKRLYPIHPHARSCNAAMPNQSLEAIQRRIALQDSELKALRRELEARHSMLRSLKQRKAALQSELRQVEAEMAAVAKGAVAPSKPAPKPSKTPVSKPAAPHKPGQPTLAQLLVSILRDASRPLSVLQLSQEAKRKGFKTTSKNPYKLIGKTVYTLAAKGTLRRAPDQSGFVVASTSNGRATAQGATAPHSKHVGTKSKAKAKHASNGSAKPAAGKASEQTPLRQVLEQILRRNTKPMTGGELAAEVVKAGYKTKSKRLADNVWTALGNMKNVENVNGQGYRLKQGK